MNLTNCKVSKQLNGNSLFVVFEGCEQAIWDAFNTLWQVNGLCSDEPEFLFMGENSGLAVAVTTPDKLKRGLFYREYLKLLEGDKVAFAKQRAQEQATKAFVSMEEVRVVTPNPFSSKLYTIGTESDKSQEWQCERTDLVEQD